jgi:N-acetylglucosamine-6-phosphate deacetylase
VTVLLHSGVRVDERGELPDAWVLLDGDSIAATGSGKDAPDATESVDLHGATVVPGFVDLHGHGGGGHAYDDGGTELAAALASHRAHGTTRALISLVANPLAELRERLAEIADLTASDPLVLGAHLEGPFLAAARRGAHNADYLRAPDAADVDGLIAAARGTLRQMTIAPELPGALDVIPQLVDAGVVVAVGHTEATAEQTHAAFDAGARMLTHAFNAMPGIHHRAPGPVVAALEDDRVTLELILDGEHVHADVARLLLEQAPGRVALVTDAMAAAGADDGDYRLGSLNVSVRNGLAHLSGTSTIAGSTLTQDAALRHVLALGIPAPAAVAALTSVPARAIGLGSRLGLIEQGYAADIVVLDETHHVTTVWAAGARLAG